jgi:hypothetical protein
VADCDWIANLMKHFEVSYNCETLQDSDTMMLRGMGKEEGEMDKNLG